MDRELVQKIQNNAAYQKLVSTRSGYAWKMSIIMLVVYYAYILFIAFSPETLGAKISPDSMITWGIPVGLVIIVFAFIMTGLYVKRANSEFDDLSKQVKQEIEEEMK